MQVLEAARAKGVHWRDMLTLAEGSTPVTDEDVDELTDMLMRARAAQEHDAERS